MSRYFVHRSVCFAIGDEYVSIRWSRTAQVQWGRLGGHESHVPDYTLVVGQVTWWRCFVVGILFFAIVTIEKCINLNKVL